jgi:hypothetical protein
MTDTPVQTHQCFFRYRGVGSGHPVGRAAPTVVRLSMIYAALDRSEQIKLDHLEAAMALWRYSYASAQALFGDLRGADPDILKLSTAVKAAGEAGLTGQQISGLFSGHRNKETIAVLLEQLDDLPGFEVTVKKTGGRPLVRARYIGAEKAEEAEKDR